MKKLLSLIMVLGITSSAVAWKVTQLPSRDTTIKMEVDVTEASSQLDILFVVDDSGSMGDYQSIVSSNIDTLIGGLVKYDVHAAVVTADMDKSSAGHFVGPILNSSDAPFLTDLKKQIMQGTQGSSFEQLFTPAVAALTPPLSLNENRDFLRPNANLIVVFLTDAEDQSALSAQAFADSMKALKTNTTGTVSLVAIYAAVATPSCLQDSGPPVKLEAALALLNGKTASLCDPNIAQSISDVGNVLTGNMASKFSRKIKLPVTPILNTVKVIYGTTTLQLGDFYEGWTYDRKNLMMWIGNEFDFTTQPAGTKLSIEYTMAPLK